jgi:hypothetical protein
MLLQPFQKLSKQEKIDFFIKIQKMLIINHPNSPFIFNKNNLKERLQYCGDLFHKYNGFSYSDENASILFNYIKMEDEKNPIESIKKYSFQSPAPDYNAIVIDFAVSKNLKDYLDFCRKVYNSNIQWVVFIHKGKPTIYRALDYITKILNVKMV